MAITSLQKITDSSYIVFFDLDHTLTGKISGRLLGAGAFRKGILSPATILKALLLQLLYSLKLLDPLKTMNEMMLWMKNLSEEAAESLCEDVVRRSVLPSIFPEALDEIKMHKSNGAFTVILSSSIRPVCSVVSEALNIEDVICTELEVSNGHYTGKPVGSFCYGDEKAERMKSYCEKNNKSLQNAWYYGDSLSDLPVLRIAGNPVCVNPCKKLEKLAKAEKWTVKYWGK